MKTGLDSQARKRPVNLTLNEDLVEQARELTDNLSGVVESLLTDYVEAARNERAAKAKIAQATAATWNRHTEKYGSFADEYSTL